MFYTNFGALASILLILSMLGIAASEIVTMLRKSTITQSLSTVPISNKDALLDSKGAAFLFGYRFIDERDQVFNDPSVLQG